MRYTPDKWVVLKIENSSKDLLLYKVLAGWYGGYLGSDVWKLSSEICKLETVKDDYLFLNRSGSVYSCNKTGYSLTQLMASKLYEFNEIKTDKIQITVLDFMTLTPEIFNEKVN